MNKRKFAESDPAILRFKAQLCRFPKTAKASDSATLLLDVPEVVSKKVRSSGMTTVEGH